MKRGGFGNEIHFLSLVGDGAQVAFFQVTRAIGFEQFLEVINLGSELGAYIGIVHKNTLMGMLNDVTCGLNILTESNGLVN